MTGNCASQHFLHALDILKPVAIVFIGKWALNGGSKFAQDCGIPFSYINRNRSLSSAERSENHKTVATFVRSIMLSRAPK